MKNLYIVLLAAAVVLASCDEPAPAAKEPAKFKLSDTMRSMIAIDSVRTCNIDDETDLSGEVSFDEDNVVKIFPRSSGQVIECNVSLGDKVTAGQVLAVIRSAEVAGNYADKTSADADIAIAKRQMDNEEALYKNGIASEKDYEEAKQDYEKALAAEQKITSLININGGSAAKPGGTYVLTAPISGYLVEKKINTGSFIRPDMGDNLFTISNLKDVWVWANVFETDIPKIKVGNNVLVTTLAYPDKIYSGKIDKISEVLDPSNKAMKVKIKLDNTDMLLKPQMFTRVEVLNEENQKATCIPASAVITLESKNYVIVYNADDDLKIQEIGILKTVGNKTYITSGLEPGQKVITKNQILLYNALSNEL